METVVCPDHPSNLQFFVFLPLRLAVAAQS
jgi:hypothetical protein